MTIGELSRRSGLATSAIRYYERIGLLPRTARLSGRRSFDEDALLRLAIVSAAAETGFTLAEIKQLVNGSGRKWREAVTGKIAELDQAVRRTKAMQQLLRQALECGCFDGEPCARLRSAGVSPAPAGRPARP